MSDLAERLAELMKRNSWDQEALAQRLDTTQPNVSRWLRGGKTKSAELYLKVERLELTHGLWVHPAGRIAVMGRVGAGAEIFNDVEQVEPEGMLEVELSIALPDGAVAYLVLGDSMHPRLNSGDVVVCDQVGYDSCSVIGWEAAVETSDGRRFFKRVLKGAEDGLFDLESHNAPLMRNVELRSVRRLYAIFPESSVRKRVRQAKA